MHFLLESRYSVKYILVEIVLLYIIVYLAKPFSGISEDLWNIPRNHYYTWASDFFLIVFVLYFMKLTSSSYFRDEFYVPKFKLEYFFNAVLLYVKFLLVLLAFLGLLVFIFYLLPDSFSSYIKAEGFKFQWKISNRIALLLMLITSFFTGAAEELIYRAFIITKLRQIGFSSFFALLISSSIFASGHLYYGFSGFFVTFVIACILGFIYLKFKNVYYVIFIHSFHNTLATILLFFFKRNIRRTLCQIQFQSVIEM